MKLKKPIPFEFVLEQLAPLAPLTKAMFGCNAIYMDEKITFILRERENYPQDNGVWLATDRQHHVSLKSDFPSMRSISLLGKAPTAWQVLPSQSPDFEEAALRACAFVLRGDPRIGKVPQRKRTKQGRVKSKS